MFHYYSLAEKRANFVEIRESTKITHEQLCTFSLHIAHFYHTFRIFLDIYLYPISTRDRIHRCSSTLTYHVFFFFCFNIGYYVDNGSIILLKNSYSTLNVNVYLSMPDYIYSNKLRKWPPNEIVQLAIKLS